MIKVEMSSKSQNILADFKKVPSKMKREVFDIIYKYGQKMRNTIIESMKKTSKDMTRPVRRGARSHYPSLPGFPPAIDTGALVNSIRIEKDEVKGKVEIGSKGNAPYSKYLETGTAKMEARPFLLPAFEAYEQDLKDSVMAAIKRTVESAK